MPSEFDELFAQGLAEATREVGTPMTLIRRTLGAYNPATGQLATTEASVALTGVVSHWKEEPQRDGGVLRYKEITLPLAALPAGQAVKTGDVFVFPGGARWTVFSEGILREGQAQDCQVRLT